MSLLNQNIRKCKQKYSQEFFIIGRKVIIKNKKKKVIYGKDDNLYKFNYYKEWQRDCLKIINKIILFKILYCIYS